jgi:hypothetical protein
MMAAPKRITQGGVSMKKLMTGLFVMVALGALRSRRTHISFGEHRNRFKMHATPV